MKVLQCRILIHNPNLNKAWHIEQRNIVLPLFLSRYMWQKVLPHMTFISGKKNLSPQGTQLVRKILWRNLNLPLSPILFDYTLHSLIQGVSTFLVFTVIQLAGWLIEAGNYQRKQKRTVRLHATAPSVQYCQAKSVLDTASLQRNNQSASQAGGSGD